MHRFDAEAGGLLHFGGKNMGRLTCSHCIKFKYRVFRITFYLFHTFLAFLSFSPENIVFSIKYMSLVLQVTELSSKEGSPESGWHHLLQVPPYSAENIVPLKYWFFN